VAVLYGTKFGNFSKKSFSETKNKSRQTWIVSRYWMAYEGIPVSRLPFPLTAVMAGSSLAENTAPELTQKCLPLSMLPFPWNATIARPPLVYLGSLQFFLCSDLDIIKPRFPSESMGF